mmetsp:Transcript_14675/g.20431  ORF Transcript_14675/g.20431 Transcript_14675/m.20431 type:complete len:233 (-) Transcript_14675:225-923(-)
MESAFASPLPIGAAFVAVPSNPPVCGSSSLISLASSTISAGSSTISSSSLMPTLTCAGLGLLSCLEETSSVVVEVSFLFRASFRSSCSFRARRARVNSRVSSAANVMPPPVVVSISVSLFCVRAVCSACATASAAPLVFFIVAPPPPDNSFNLRNRRAFANAALRNASSGSSSRDVSIVLFVASWKAVVVRTFPFAMILSNFARFDASSGSFFIAAITSSFSASDDPAPLLT